MRKWRIVTGAGSGIGREIALLYAAQGAKVVVADVNMEAAGAVTAEIAKAGGTANAQPMNVATKAKWQGAIAATVQRYGRLDIMVNNAGISSVGNLLETSAEEFDRVMSVNLKGVFLCSKYAVAQMLAQEPAGGVLMYIASVAGMIALDRRAAYGASKGGVIALTRSSRSTSSDRGSALTPSVPAPCIRLSLRATWSATIPTARTKCASNCTLANR